MARVIVVDDHAMLRLGVCLTLEDLGWEIVAQVGTALEALRAFKTLAWDLGVLDIQLPDQSGMDLLQDLRQSGIHGPILVHSMLPESAAARVFKLGGNGFINKGCDPDELVQAAKRVLGGGRYVSPAFAESLAESLATGRPVGLHDTLSERESQVMQLIAQGRTPGQIAHELGCNINTISTYRSRILSKLQLKNSIDIMRYALKHRLVNL